MTAQDAEIDMEIIELLNKTLELVQEDKGLKYMETLIAKVENDIKAANLYANSKNIDFGTAISSIYKRRELGSYCIYGC